MLTGVTASTKQNLQLGAGVLCTEYSTTLDTTKLISATRGGGTFIAAPVMRNIEADGIPSNTADFKVIDEWNVTLNVTLLEFTQTTLLLALGNATAAEKTITADNTIATTCYKDVYWIGDLADGNKIVIKIKNALNTSGLNITITNKGEGTFVLTLTGHYTVADLSGGKAPFEIIR